MSDKERLEEIKSRVWRERCTYAVGDEASREGYRYILSDEDYEWLIKQAEKTDRYHNVLHKIAYGPETGSEINGINYRLDHKKWQRLATDVLEESK